MPFITKERRENIAQYGLGWLKDVAPGDRCYVFYKSMVDRWKAHPSWTTAHQMFNEILLKNEHLGNDDFTAKHLAWQVFFIKYVMPYENQKEIENGAI